MIQTKMTLLFNFKNKSRLQMNISVSKNIEKIMLYNKNNTGVACLLNYYYAVAIVLYTIMK